MKYILSPILSFLLLLNSGWLWWSAAAQTPSPANLRVVSSGDREIVLELTAGDLQVEAVTHDGQEYQRLAMPGTVGLDMAGAPQLPVRGTTVGVGSTAGLAVEVVDAEIDTRAGFRLLPAPTQQASGDTLLDGQVSQTIIPDPAIYSRDAFYPEQPVALGQTGLMRDQPVAQLHFYPVRFNPVSGEIELYRRLLIRLRWDAPAMAMAAANSISPDYEAIMARTLLNYSSLNRPPASAATSSPAIGAPAIAAGPASALKIGVEQDGIYQLTHADLSGAGFDLNGVDPQTLRLTNQGRDIPIYIAGEADGVFDPADVILFYGKAMTTVYTSRNVYWLAAGSGPGPRMPIHVGTPQGAPVPTHFPTTLHAEQDTIYWQSMPDGAGQDHWFWGLRYTAPQSNVYTVTLKNISTTASTATVRLQMKGQSDISSVNPDHHTKVYLNGNDIEPGGQWWDGLAVFEQEVVVPHTSLTEGSNIIGLEGVGDTGAAVDQFWFNWLEIDYWDTYVAENNLLNFGAPTGGPFQFEVSGFSSNGVQVFEITNPDSPVLVVNTAILAQGGSYTVQFEDTAQPDTRYLALAPDRYFAPAHLELDQPTAWRSTGQGADYIIITHQDFYTSALALANYRQSTGLRTATVKVNDVYDEFNEGIFDPVAIRNFLAYAYQNWQAPAPTYVLLIGDASFDFKDNYGIGKLNYVPTQMIETDLLGETPSDNWFVTVSGNDIIPDLLIGRISAETTSEVDAAIAKVLQFEGSPATAPWKKQALFVADDGSSAFEHISDQLAGMLPATVFTATKVYAGNYPPGSPTDDIKAQINSGTLLINYVGHGNSLRWGSWSGGVILGFDDILALNNSDRLPFVTVANCLNGFFNSPFETPTRIPVAESFTRSSSGGAAAVWAPTGLGYPSGHHALMTEFYQQIFINGENELGLATMAAKVAIAGQNPAWDELVETFVFFGDPAMRMSTPSLSPPANPAVYLPVVIRN